MTVTLTSNYRETLLPDTLATLERVQEDRHDFDLGHALLFIDTHSERAFVECYEQYLTLTDDYGCGAVDAFLTINTADELDEFESAYLGYYTSPGRMAQDYFDDEWERLDYRIVVDWDETGDYLLAHDVDCADDHYFRCL